MKHLKIRKFNTAQMYPGKGMDNDLCMAVKAGNRIFLRGQTGFDLEGNMTGVGDPTAQTEMAMQCVKTLLEEAGSKLEHICKTTIYLTDRAYREEVYSVIGKHLKGIHVCSTGLIVQGLARPEMVMEIDVEAIIPEK
ncbi:Rid family hydrolase [Alphaproteobacteria bacterium]|nr:Rid family hydrolase [Alphaproteobacteria bacterium]